MYVRRYSKGNRRGFTSRRARKMRYVGRRRRVFKRVNKRRRLPLDDQRLSRVVKLRYTTSEIVTKGAVAGAMVPLRTFRANSIWDPDYTGVGNSVSDYARWASLYDHYTVLGSKITYTISKNEGDINALVFMSKLDDDGSAFTAADSYYKWNSDRQVKMKTFNLTSYTSQAQFSFSRKFSAKRFFDLKNPKDVDSITANMGANPADGAFYCAAVQAANLTDHIPTSFVMVTTIDYIVRFGEPKDRYDI